jgi:hypothetical protein
LKRRFSNIEEQVSGIVMKAEIYSITYRIPLSNAQQARLDRKWPDGEPMISYERIESLLAPLPVENLDWSHHSGQFLYFTVYGTDIEGTVAEVVERLERKLCKS